MVLDKKQRHAISLVAHAMVAKNLSHEIEGLNGFEEHYLSTLNQRDRAIIKLFWEEESVALKSVALNAFLERQR